MSKIDLNAVDSSSAVTLLKWMAESINEEITKRDKRIAELEFKLNLLLKGER